jgi:hypothetical protein
VDTIDNQLSSAFYIEKKLLVEKKKSEVFGPGDKLTHFLFRFSAP